MKNTPKLNMLVQVLTAASPRQRGLTLPNPKNRNRRARITVGRRLSERTERTRDRCGLRRACPKQAPVWLWHHRRPFGVALSLGRGTHSVGPTLGLLPLEAGRNSANDVSSNRFQRWELF